MTLDQGYKSQPVDSLIPSHPSVIVSQYRQVPLASNYYPTLTSIAWNYTSSINKPDLLMAGNGGDDTAISWSNITWSNISNITNATSGGEEEAPKWGALALSILILCTTLGNTLVILAVCWERRLQNMTNYFLLSLAVADFLVSLLVMPLGMIVTLYDKFPFDPHLCAAWFTCDVLMCTASIWHMCTMSMDRYLTLRYPMRYGRNKTKSTVVIKIMCVWLISILITSPISIMGFMNTDNVYADGLCAPRVDSFVIYGSIFAFYVPLAIMVITYVLTIRILQNNRKMAMAMGRHKSYSRGSVQNGCGSTQNGYSNSHSDTGPMLRPQSPTRVDFSQHSTENNIKVHENGDCGTSSPETEQGPETPLIIRDRRGTCVSLDSMSTSESDRTFHNSDDSCSIDLKQHSLSVNNLRETDILSAFARVNSCPTLYTLGKRMSREAQSDDENEDNTEQSVDNEHRKLYRLFGERRPAVQVGTKDEKSENHVQPTSVFTKSLALPKNNSEKNLLDWLERPKLKLDVCQNLIKEETSDTASSLDLSNKVSLAITDGVMQDVNENSKLMPQLSLPSVGRQEIPMKNLKQVLTSKQNLESSGIPVVTVSYHEDAVKRKIKKRRPSKFRTSVCTMQPVQYELDRNFLHPPVRSPVKYTDVTKSGIDPRRPSFWTELKDKKSEKQQSQSQPTMSLMRRVKRVRATTRRLLINRAHQSNEQKASKVLGIIFAVFVVLWTPFFFVNLLGGFCSECVQAISADVMTMFLWLGYIASLANPLIYTCFNTSFRRAFVRILKCRYITHQGSPYQSTSYNDRYTYTERRFTAATISLKQ